MPRWHFELGHVVVMDGKGRQTTRSADGDQRGGMPAQLANGAGDVDAAAAGVDVQAVRFEVDAGDGFAYAGSIPVRLDGS